jgi:hypothetical protein
VSRAARRDRPRREQRRQAEDQVERILELYLADNRPSAIAEIMGIPEELVISILETMAQHLEEEGGEGVAS